MFDSVIEEYGITYHLSLTDSKKNKFFIGKSKEGNMILAKGKGKTINIWDIPLQSLVDTLKPTRNTHMSIAKEFMSADLSYFDHYMVKISSEDSVSDNDSNSSNIEEV